jgi:hypothetical protein
VTYWLIHHLHKFPTCLDISGNQIPVTAPEAAGLQHRGSKSDKDTSRLTGRTFLATTSHRMDVPRFTADASCKSLQPSPNSSPLIFDYTSLRTAGASNDSSSRQYPLLSSRRSLLFRNRRRRHIALPLYLSLEICYVLPDLLSLLFSFFYRVAYLALLLLLLCSYLDIQTLRSLLFFVGPLLWGLDEWGRFTC